MARIKEYCKWVEDVLCMSKAHRVKLSESVLDAISLYRGRKQKPEDSEYLTDWLRKNCELIGFSGNLNYIATHDRVRGMTRDIFENINIHPWGAPAVLLKHKTMPMFIICGPGLKLDEKVIGATG